MRSVLPKWIIGVGLVLGILVFAGVLYGLTGSLSGGGFYALWRDGTAASWPWWYYVLAIPALGAAGLLVELIGEAIGSVIHGYFEPKPRLRRAIYLTFTLGFTGSMIVFIIWLALR